MMCKSKSRIMHWLLGLAFLAAIVGTAPAAYAAACPAGSLELISMSAGVSLGGGSRHVGDVSTTGLLVMTNTSSCDGVGENVTMGQQLNLVPACTVVPGGGSTCASPDSGVITVTSASSDAGACTGSAITWTVGGGPGAYTLTNPGGDIPLAAGGVCTVHFSYTVDKLPTVDAKTSTPNVLDTGQSIAATLTADSGSTAGGTGSNSSPFTFTCSVQVDKEISCDGGSNFSDTGFADGTTGGCVGKNGVADIKVKYIAKNTSDSGIGLVSCTIGESNVNLGPGVTSFDIANGATTGDLGLTPNALVCETARGTSEPDTGHIDCTCNVPLLTQPHATDNDTATFGCCGVQVDKQVSCNGAAFVDVGFADGATGSCSAQIGQPLALQYLIKNTGDFPVTCTISDDQSNANNIFAGPGGTVAAGQTTITPISNTNVTTCTSDLSANEPNTATASCSCDGGTLGSVTVSDQDTASFNCTANPSFSVSKTCTPTATTGSFDLAVTVTNTDNATGSQLSCTATDAVFPGSCPAAGTSVPGPTLVTQPLSVAASPSNCDPNTGANCSTGTLTGSLTGQNQTTCDVATVTCTSGGVTLDSKTASAECPVSNGQCFTRTPGYWGTHPPNTQTVLGAGLEVCGVLLTNTNAPTTSGSAIEDLCSQNANEAKFAVSPPTSTQQLQLIRQCTSAALNLRVSSQAGFDCNATSGGFPGITAKFAACCSDAGTCNSNQTGAQIDASGCIPFLDAFNNQFDNAPFPQGSGLSDIPADSAACQTASGDRLVNQPRNYGHK